MHFEPGEVYHLYNRGTDKQKIFFNHENYLFFLRKIRSEWLPYCDVLAYCLMTNHFHFLIVPNSKGCTLLTLKEKETHLQQLSKVVGKTLSSYTQAINKERKRSGTLFQKKTKAKLIDLASDKYLITCIHYIHLNPVLAQLVKHESEWEYSSYQDYSGLRNGTLCNKELFFKFSGLTEIDFKLQPHFLDKEVIEDLF